MPTCCRRICASCAASSTARTCRSTSRARCCRTIPIVAQIRKAVTGRVISELESLAGSDAERFGKVWEAFGSVIKEGIYEDHERRDQLLALARFGTTKDGDARTLEAVRGGSAAQPDRHLLSGRRHRRAPQVEPEARGRPRARRRGAPADRPGRCVLDVDAAGLRRQAAQVAQPGRRRLRPHPPARRQAQGRRRPEGRGRGRRRDRSRRSRPRSASASPTCAPRSG